MLLHLQPSAVPGLVEGVERLFELTALDVRERERKVGVPVVGLIESTRWYCAIASS